MEAIDKLEEEFRFKHGSHVMVASERTCELFLIRNVMKCHAHVRRFGLQLGGVDKRRGFTGGHLEG
jgi:hypothetical protein